MNINGIKLVLAVADEIITTQIKNKEASIMAWFNTNQGFVGAVLSVLTIVLSVIAIWISIATGRKQNKISLFEKRSEAFSAIYSISNHFPACFSLYGMGLKTITTKIL